jgi:hypothetical protein
VLVVPVCMLLAVVYVLVCTPHRTMPDDGGALGGAGVGLAWCWFPCNQPAVRSVGGQW